MIYASMVGDIHMALTKGMRLLKRVSNPNDFPQAVERIVREDPDLRDKYDVASVTWDFDGGGGYSVRVWGKLDCWMDWVLPALACSAVFWLSRTYL